MNATAILLAPWRATRSATNWYPRILLSLFCAGGLVLLLFVHAGEPIAATIALTPLALGEFIFGARFLAPTLLLALDGRQLRIPGMTSGMIVSVLLYAALAWSVPSAALMLLTPARVGPAEAGVLALALAAGISFSLLPRSAVTLVWLMPMLLNIAGWHPALPALGDPGFAALCGGSVLGLVALSAASWRRQMRMADTYRQSSAWAPLALQFRQASAGWSAWSGLWGHSGSSLEGLRRVPAWLHSPVDVRRSGPAQVRRSLGIALGGFFAPRSVPDRLRRIVGLGLPSLMLVLLVDLQHMQHQGGHGWSGLLAGIGPGAVAWLGGFGSAAAAIVPLMQLHQGWQRSNAELPLLALLPGLGNRETVRRALLKACLMPMLRTQALLLLGLLALAMALHMRGVPEAVTLAQVGITGFAAALMLCILGGKPLPGWAVLSLAAPVFVLVLGTLILPLAGADPTTLSPRWLLGLAGGWLAVALVLLGLGLRGWSGYVQRPHPFLGSARAMH